MRKSDYKIKRDNERRIAAVKGATTAPKPLPFHPPKLEPKDKQ